MCGLGSQWSASFAMRSQVVPSRWAPRPRAWRRRRGTTETPRPATCRREARIGRPVRIGFEAENRQESGKNTRKRRQHCEPPRNRVRTRGTRFDCVAFTVPGAHVLLRMFAETVMPMRFKILAVVAGVLAA